MKQLITPLLFLSICSQQLPAASKAEILDYYNTLFETPGAGHFTAPDGWVLGDPDALPGSITMIVTKPSGIRLAPTINVAEEPFDRNTEAYMEVIQGINQDLGYPWRRLGSIQTKAGRAQLCQREIVNEWGTMRQMHVVLVKNHRAYIVTATAPTDDFPKYYKTFSQAFKSFAVNN